MKYFLIAVAVIAGYFLYEHFKAQPVSASVLASSSSLSPQGVSLWHQLTGA